LSFEHAEFKNVSVEAKRLIQRLLDKDPLKRINIAEALNHEFFRSEIVKLSHELEINKNDEL